MTRIRAALEAAAPDLAPEVLDKLAEAATEAAFLLEWFCVDEDNWKLNLGAITVGEIFRSSATDWAVRGRVITDHRSSAKDEAAARAALVAAVMEAIYADNS